MMDVSRAHHYRARSSSPPETQTRLDLAALYRILHQHGMSDLANQEAGARIADRADHFLIHPYGLFYDEISASRLIAVGPNGAPVDPDAPAINDGGCNLARWIFGARPDVSYFIHGHCEEVMAVGSTREGLLPLNQPAVYLQHFVGYIEYEFSEDAEFGTHFMSAIRQHDILVSRNHGYYTTGRTAAEAFFRAYYLKQACSAQIKTLSMGLTPHPIDPQKVARFQDEMYASSDYNYDGQTEWDGLIRRLEREHPDYRS
jgi:ribulose-5-phosphate 4-epimerase/fuculose-1-phosphate aldolase